MTDTKYLNKAIHTEDLKAGAINLIEAPCGSGKSRFVLDKLPETVSRNSKLLYAIDIINGKEQKLKKPAPYGTGRESLSGAAHRNRQALANRFMISMMKIKPLSLPGPTPECRQNGQQIPRCVYCCGTTAKKTSSPLPSLIRLWVQPFGQ